MDPLDAFFENIRKNPNVYPPNIIGWLAPVILGFLLTPIRLVCKDNPIRGKFRVKQSLVHVPVVNQAKLLT